MEPTTVMSAPPMPTEPTVITQPEPVQQVTTIQQTPAPVEPDMFSSGGILDKKMQWATWIVLGLVASASVWHIIYTRSRLSDFSTADGLQSQIDELKREMKIA